MSNQGMVEFRFCLDGHNRRRRKPQHDLMSLGGFFPCHKRTFELTYVDALGSMNCSWDAIFAEKLNFKVPLIWLEFRVAHA